MDAAPSMTKTPASQRSQTRIPRRSGCQTCKTRHKKCDEQKPQCGNCAKLGLECKKSDAFRASRLSRSYQSSVSLPKDSPDTIGNETSRDVAQETIFSFLIGSHKDRITGVSPTQPMGAMLGTETSVSENYLLWHYIQRSSSVLINVDGPTNCLRRMILPRLASSKGLLSAVYALSALHLESHNSNSKCRAALLRYYTNTVSCVRNSITSLQDARFLNGLSVQSREDLLLTTVFLCKFEIVSGGFENWRSHIAGIRVMLQLFDVTPDRFSGEVLGFVRSFVSYHSHISGITEIEGYAPPSEARLDENAFEQLQRTKQVDLYMGFCEEYIYLLHLAARATAVGCTQDVDSNILLGILVKIHQVCREDALPSSQYEIPTWISKEATSQLDAIANGYRNALLIYTNEILDSISEVHMDDASILRCRRIRGSQSLSKDEAISACLGSIISVPEHTPHAVGLCPLFFIIAIETRDENEFLTCLERLERLWKSTHLGNIRTAVDLLRMVQQRKSHDWRALLRLQNWDLIVS